MDTTDQGELRLDSPTLQPVCMPCCVEALNRGLFIELAR